MRYPVMGRRKLKSPITRVLKAELTTPSRAKMLPKTKNPTMRMRWSMLLVIAIGSLLPRESTARPPRSSSSNSFTSGNKNNGPTATGMPSLSSMMDQRSSSSSVRNNRRQSDWEEEEEEEEDYDNVDTAEGDDNDDDEEDYFEDDNEDFSVSRKNDNFGSSDTMADDDDEDRFQSKSVVDDLKKSRSGNTELNNFFKMPLLKTPVFDNEHSEDDDGGGYDREDGMNEKGGLPMQKSKKAMYEAYNQLHSLAQDYDKPFDAPAVVVVGHQSSGKSALIEALMGFQFNQVGGGTKTRRPVALRMQYNPSCVEPRWFLVGEDGVERPKSLSEVQDYIDQENRRLERDPMRSFDPQEINIRMEYKHCPNMILIDTPGLISAPRVPRGRNGDGAALAQQRALQASAREAERLVVGKMQCEDYIILCVEDTNDWKHGTTREVVQKADPDLSRTVIVNTKFDTKIPQFGTPSDVVEFLRASILDKISPHKLGGPFFTSVPSGRVGRPMSGGGDHHHNQDYLFDKDEDFVHACAAAEKTDRGTVQQRLKRVGKISDGASARMLNRIGLANLRSFLEKRVDECYRRNIQKIIPMLHAEYVTAEKRLKACERELEALSVDRLKGGVDKFCDEYCICLRKALQGTIIAPTTLFGETLRMETASGGSFHDIQGCPMAVSDRTWERLVETDVGNKDAKLYGGSQYHRTLREFHLATRCLRFPTISDDEIANAAGIGESHDGVNFLHAACTISLEKARLSFEPMLARLQMRMVHVMNRLGPVTEYMLRENRERAKLNAYSGDGNGGGATGIGSLDKAIDVSQNPQFRQLIRGIFESFIQQCSDNAMNKCRDDMMAITKYVTWSLDSRGGNALSQALPDQTDMVTVYQVALKTARKSDKNHQEEEKPAPDTSKDKPGSSLAQQQPLTPVPDPNQNSERDYQNLIQLVEEAFMTRDTERTNLVVAGLAQHIVSGWREQFCKSVVMKYNCYFMLPFVDQFHLFLRTRLREIYEGQEGNLTDVLDITAARRSLEKDRANLLKECQANKNLQEKFRHIARFMKDTTGPSN